MADKIKKNTKKDETEVETTPAKSKKKVGKIFKIILILMIVLILAATAFAVGIYLKFIDTQDMVNKMKLDQYPVVGKYFSQPKTNFEPVEGEPQNPVVVPPEVTAPVPVIPNPAIQPEAIVPEKKVDETELLKQAKIKQQEEAKRISKLARLYGTMKPDEAVPILNQMDDDTVLVILSKMDDEQVAKIMALLDNRRAAILSQSMLRGRNNLN